MQNCSVSYLAHAGKCLQKTILMLCPSRLGKDLLKSENSSDNIDIWVCAECCCQYSSLPCSEACADYHTLCPEAVHVVFLNQDTSHMVG